MRMLLEMTRIPANMTMNPRSPLAWATGHLLASSIRRTSVSQRQLRGQRPSARRLPTSIALTLKGAEYVLKLGFCFLRDRTQQWFSQ